MFSTLQKYSYIRSKTYKTTVLITWQIGKMYKSFLGRSPGRGNGNPLQYSCLENSRGRELQRVRHDWACTRTKNFKGVQGGEKSLPFWGVVRTARKISQRRWHVSWDRKSVPPGKKKEKRERKAFQLGCGTKWSVREHEPCLGKAELNHLVLLEQIVCWKEEWEMSWKARLVTDYEGLWMLCLRV